MHGRRVAVGETWRFATRDAAVEYHRGEVVFRGAWRVEDGQVVVRSDYGVRSAPAGGSAEQNLACAKDLLGAIIRCWSR